MKSPSASKNNLNVNLSECIFESNEDFGNLNKLRKAEFNFESNKCYSRALFIASSSSNNIDKNIENYTIILLPVATINSKTVNVIVQIKSEVRSLNKAFSLMMLHRLPTFCQHREQQINNIHPKKQLADFLAQKDSCSEQHKKEKTDQNLNLKITKIKNQKFLSKENSSDWKELHTTSHQNNNYKSNTLRIDGDLDSFVAAPATTPAASQSTTNTTRITIKSDQCTKTDGNNSNRISQQTSYRNRCSFWKCYYNHYQDILNVATVGGYQIKSAPSDKNISKTRQTATPTTTKAEKSVQLVVRSLIFSLSSSASVFDLSSLRCCCVLILILYLRLLVKIIKPSQTSSREYLDC